MKVLVTGANGYLGGCVVDVFESQGTKVARQDSHGNDIRPRMLSDISRSQLLEADVIVHLGWRAKAGNGEADAQYDSLERTEQIVDDLREDQLLIFASSVSVYGDRGDKECAETDPVQPVCLYSKAKAAAESYIRNGVDRYTIFRFGSLMGRGVTRTKRELCVNAFAIDGYTRGVIEVWNPNAWKPVLHVKDAAALICSSIVERWQERIGSAVLNAAQGAYPASALAYTAGRITKAKVVEVEDKSGPRSCRVNCDGLRKRLTYWDMRNVAEAIEEFKDYKDVPQDVQRDW